MSKQQVIISVLGDTKPFQKAMDGLGGSLKTLGTVAAVGLAATAAGVAGLTTSAVKAYGEFEQLAGGVTKLFGEADETVQKFARNAAQTAGLSTNQYLDTVTSFSASLIAGLGGDQAAAAKVADLAITDMADNANTFGTSMESIQLAYQGFAKDNFTMLDNLKLGYGGTASEMARLVNDSGVMGDSFKATAENVKDIPFDKMIEAIHQVQSGMNITGTTAREASSTIQGSFAATRASLDNFVLGFAQADADFGELTNNLVTNALNLVTNIIPIIGRVAEAIPVMIPALIQALSDVLPELLPVAGDVILSLVDGIVEAAPKVITAAIPVVLSLVQGLLKALPKILSAGLQIILALVQGITAALPTLIPAAVEAVIGIVNALIENLPLLLTAALEMITALGEGLIAALPNLIAQLPTLILGIVDFLVAAIPQIIETGIQLFLALIGALPDIINGIVDALPQIIVGIVTAIIGAIPQLITAGIDLFLGLIGALPDIIVSIVNSVPKIIDGLVKAFTDPKTIGKLASAGGQLLKGLWQGIQDLAGWLWRQVTKLGDNIVGWVKGIFGIHSPSTVFAGIGKNLVKGLEVGLSASNNLDRIMTGLTSQVSDGFQANLSMPTSYGTAGAGAGGVTVNFNGLVTDPVAAGREVHNVLTEYQRVGGRS